MYMYVLLLRQGALKGGKKRRTWSYLPTDTYPDGTCFF
jgi:hypothetical protein